MYYMTEFYQQATPFEYEKKQDKVIYHPDFDHIDPELFNPKNCDKLDSRRISELTTWKPDVSNETIWTTPFNKTNKPNNSL